MSSEDDDSFVVEDSDEEAGYGTGARGNDDSQSDVIPESDEDDDTAESDSDDAVGDDLTKSIHKAIRRSILNISRHLSDGEVESGEQEEVADGEKTDEDFHHSLTSTAHKSPYFSHKPTVVDSDEDSPPRVQKKRFNRILVESSDDEAPPRRSTPRQSSRSSLPRPQDLSLGSEDDDGTADGRRTSAESSSFVQNGTSEADESRGSAKSRTNGANFSQLIDDSSEEDKESSAAEREEARESDEDVKEVPVTGGKTEVISIDSDTPSDHSGTDRSAGEVAAMSLAQEELGLNSVDPLVAQKRAMLVIEIQNVEREILRIGTFLKSGQIQHLPDGGKKLLDTQADRKARLAKLKADLAECRLVEQYTPKVSAVEESPQRPSIVKIPKKPSLDSSGEYQPDSSLEEPLTPSPELKKNPPFNATLLNRPTTAPIGDLGKKALETFQEQQALTLETLKTFHGSLLSRPAENEEAEDPHGLTVPLMSHQRHALAWLLWREQQKPPGGVLADDMGLGKTLTMISLVLKSRERETSGNSSDDEWNDRHRQSKHLGGTLVVCPASLIAQWEGEVQKRCKRGLLNVELYHGNRREKVPKRLARNDMVITTYNIVSRENKDNGVLFRVHWHRVILDEGHVIRNHKSQICEAVCALAARKRWVLSGTPIHNKEMDLFSVLKFLQCSPFNDIRVWKRWVDNKNFAGHERLATVMKTLMLRRTKQELMASGALESLPEKFTEVINVTLDDEERLVYDKVMLYSATVFAQFLHQRAEKEQLFRLGGGYYDAPYVNKKNPFNKAQQKLLAQHADAIQSHEILTLLMRLRQICVHPSLIDQMLDREEFETNAVEGLDAELTDRMNNMRIRTTLGKYDNEEAPDGPAQVDERVAQHLLTAENPVFERARESSKLRAVLEIVEDVVQRGEKVIIVSQWTSVLEIIAEQLQARGVKESHFGKLTGKVQVKDRPAVVDSFNNERNPRILLLSLTAGGVGLNLVGGNHLVLVDIHWNPQLESQAQDRIYRFGQKKNVFIYKFICADTIEEKITKLHEQKLAMAQSVLSGGGKAVSAKLTLDDLRSLFS